MTWLGVASIGAAVALAMLVAAFAWLLLRRQFTAVAMSPEEAGRHLVRGGRMTPNVGARFYGKASGTSWTAQLGNDRLRELLKTGQWREAAPWLLLAAGVVLAFPFWPFLMLQWVGAPGPLAAIAGILLLVILVRTLRSAYGPRERT